MIKRLLGRIMAVLPALTVPPGTSTRPVGRAAGQDHAAAVIASIPIFLAKQLEA
jgi:hypothetical protein